MKNLALTVMLGVLWVAGNLQAEIEDNIIPIVGREFRDHYSLQLRGLSLEAEGELCEIYVWDSTCDSSAYGEITITNLENSSTIFHRRYDIPYDYYNPGGFGETLILPYNAVLQINIRGQEFSHFSAIFGDEIVAHGSAYHGEYPNWTDTLTIPGPPVASFTYLPEEPMVGGNIVFDASSSHDSDGTIVRYEWDFEDGPSETRQEPRIEHLFEVPKTYIVTLTVTDDDGLTDSTSEKVELPLKNGDLLLWRSEGSPVPGFWTHVGMYYEPSNKVIEARRGYPVMRHPLSDWFFDEKTCVRALEVKTDQATRDAAVNFAMDRLGLGYDLYSALADQKQDGTNLSDLDQRWYCSELVWAAYLSASNGQINLDPDQGVVSPSEIDDSVHVKLLGEHIEDIPGSVWFPWFYGTALSPVDLIVTDPDGLVLNKQGSQIPGAIYQEVDTNADNELDDFFAIPEPKAGVYLIHVIAEAGASPTDTFTLVVNRDGTTRVLAQDVQVQDIPDFPFVVTTLASLSADVEIDPETLNLSSKGNWITCYIQFPEAYYIANIDSSTILLNGEIHPARLFAGDEEDIEQILMIKFDRSNLQKIIEPGNIDLIVTGELFDGTPFEGTDTIRVIDKGGKK